MKCPVITPHLDKRWHLIKYLPDLDENNQLKQEREIIHAVVQGLLFDKIHYEPRSRNDSHCRYTVQFEGVGSNGFIVSNGTECDQFFELFDALSINPPYLRRILDMCETEMRTERDRRQVTVKESRLSESLKRFQVRQFEHAGAAPHSILEVPVFYRLSIAKPMYDQEFAETMADAIMAMLKKLIGYYTDSDEACFEYGNALLEQYRLFQTNIRARESDEENLSRDPLVVLIQRKVRSELETLGLDVPEARA